MKHHAVQGAKYPKLDVKFGLREVRPHHAEKDPPDTFCLSVVSRHVWDGEGPVDTEFATKVIHISGCEFRTVIRMPCHDLIFR